MAQDGVVVFADASVHKEKKTTNIDVVVMDTYGNLLHAFAIANRMEMENAREKGWTKYFEVDNVMHIPRSWNLVAHNLAKFSILLVRKVVWLSTFPRWIIGDAITSFNSLNLCMH
ncbi:hypothetical protein R3W88_022881 [Solanum pinnatisectum]|uniref:RNase H type-1 domain-containing protein n=1 Tax=Solanum pinnatisectum TaxID=50273 RepID=A0AAV9LW57_9SOLN|nr:hypothetical protein R3W88_022881 [Solanum pinnatisectum]